MNPNITHCVHGHEYTPENTMIRRERGTNTVRRRCRECHRLQQIAKRDRARREDYHGQMCPRCGERKVQPSVPTACWVCHKYKNLGNESPDELADGEWVYSPAKRIKIWMEGRAS